MEHDISLHMRALPWWCRL